MPSLLPEKKKLSILAKNSLKIENELTRSEIFHMKTRVFLKYFIRALSLETVFCF